MYSKEEREYYNMHRNNVCESLGLSTTQYNWLRRKGNELHKIYEDRCNGYIDEQYEPMTTAIERVVDKKASELGSFIYYQTDPRGSTIYADVKPIQDNNYPRSYCIY